MAQLKIEAEPGELGFDGVRLARITSHFQRYVDDGRLAGWLVLVSRRGQIVHLATCGERDKASGAPVELDTIFRAFSMTKPVTTVAAMMLAEEGLLQLRDPVAAILPEFADQRVYRSGSPTNATTEPVRTPMEVWHLMTHTSGLTYGFLNLHPVDAMYRRAGFEWVTPPGMSLADCCRQWAALPLLFQPGAEWNYSVATDVLGRVVEVVSGQSLDEFFAARVFEPLGMVDTGFAVPSSDLDRLAALYFAQPGTLEAVPSPILAEVGTAPPDALLGGGGLVTTAADYHRFTQLLLSGGELDGERLLGSRTVAYMMRNHLPGDADLTIFGRPIFAETAFDGIGFGLGGSVVIDPVKAKGLMSAGEFAWGGAASTAFWVDPAEEITALFLTQLLPSSTHPIRPQLRQLVYQALVD